MSDRETRELTTPGGNKVVLRGYLTGREVATLKSVLFSSLQMNVGDTDTRKLELGGFSGAVLAEQERKTLEYLLVSVDGITADPVDVLLDLPSPEYDAVLKEIEKIKNPTTPQNSEQPGSGTSEAAQ